MTKKVRVHALRDPSVGGDLADELLHAARAVGAGRPGFEKVAGPAIAKMRSQFLGEVREDRDVPLLTTLPFADVKHRLVR